MCCVWAWCAQGLRSDLRAHSVNALQELDAKDTFTFPPKITGAKRKRDDGDGGGIIDLVAGGSYNSEDDEDYDGHSDDDISNSSNASDSEDSDGSDDGYGGCRACQGQVGGFQCARRTPDVHHTCSVCYAPFPTRAEYVARGHGAPPPEQCAFCLKFMCDAFWTAVDGAG